MGSLSTVLSQSYLPVINKYIYNTVINPQVFYALFPCVVHNSNLSFCHVKTNEILNFLFIFSFYFVFSSVMKKDIGK